MTTPLGEKRKSRPISVSKDRLNAFDQRIVDMWSRQMYKIRTAAESAAALNVAEGPDLVALARPGDDLALELHGYGNALHKAGLHRQGTAADVAAGMIETIVEELRNGG
jgi:hypothetical protein